MSDEVSGFEWQCEAPGEEASYTNSVAALRFKGLWVRQLRDDRRVIRVFILPAVELVRIWSDAWNDGEVRLYDGN